MKEEMQVGAKIKALKLLLAVRDTELADSRRKLGFFSNHYRCRECKVEWTPELHDAICSEDGDAYSDHPTRHDWYSNREGEMCNKMLAAQQQLAELQREVERMKAIAVEPLADDVPCAGPEAPACDNIDELISMLATIRKRFGNTAIKYRVQWGENSLRIEDEQKQQLADRDRQIEGLKQMLEGAWLDYDHYPYQMGTPEHDAMRRGYVVCDDGKPADSCGGSVVYQMKPLDIDAALQQIAARRQGEQT